VLRSWPIQINESRAWDFVDRSERRPGFDHRRDRHPRTRTRTMNSGSPIKAADCARSCPSVERTVTGIDPIASPSESPCASRASAIINAGPTTTEATNRLITNRPRWWRCHDSSPWPKTVGLRSLPLTSAVWPLLNSTVTRPVRNVGSDLTIPRAPLRASGAPTLPIQPSMSRFATTCVPTLRLPVSIAFRIAVGVSYFLKFGECTSSCTCSSERPTGDRVGEARIWCRTASTVGGSHA